MTGDHSVVIRVPLSDNDLGSEADDALVEMIERFVRTALEQAPCVGYWDGHEFGAGWALIFCYGRDGTSLTERATTALLSAEIGYVTSDAPTSDPPDALEELRCITVTRRNARNH